MFRGLYLNSFFYLLLFVVLLGIYLREQAVQLSARQNQDRISSVYDEIETDQSNEGEEKSIFSGIVSVLVFVNSRHSTFTGVVLPTYP